jgi:hypothetical protein
MVIRYVYILNPGAVKGRVFPASRTEDHTGKASKVFYAILGCLIGLFAFQVSFRFSKSVKGFWSPPGCIPVVPSM